MSETYRIQILGKPHLMNQLARSHWRQNADSTRLYRQLAKIETLNAKIPPLKECYIAVRHHVKKASKGRPPDPLACAPSVKAIIDGIVDAKVLKDDSGKYIRGIEFLPIVEGDRDALEIIITEA